VLLSLSLSLSSRILHCLYFISEYALFQCVIYMYLIPNTGYVYFSFIVRIVRTYLIYEQKNRTNLVSEEVNRILLILLHWYTPQRTLDQINNRNSFICLIYWHLSQIWHQW
jgi:heme/copper-type cytochrome/quinol oxidase subunit 3